MTKHLFLGALVAGSLAFASTSFADPMPATNGMAPHDTMAPATNGMAPHDTMTPKNHHKKKPAATNTMAPHDTMAPASGGMAPAGGGMSGSH
ncbi:MAG TPA: hypothetical protein VGU69_12780 [Rhizomicrobium sp.]|nr:hypothetical protein [Rhizomicrobium sp.]